MEAQAMIGRLKGVLVSKQPPWLMLDVNGVGYELEAPMSTFYDLPEVGLEVTLCTHYAVKEDSVALYGFLREAERSLFRHVQKVSGIGAKIALAVLSGASVEEFSRLVQNGDIAALTRIPGIGKKTAERLIVELRDKMARLDVAAGGGTVADGAGQAARGDALAALEALGFARAVAERKMRLVLRAQPGLQSADELVRLALREAG